MATNAMQNRQTVASSESIWKWERGVLRPPLIPHPFSGGLHIDRAVLHTRAEATVPTLDDDGQTRIGHLVGVHSGVRVDQAHIGARDTASERIELAVGAVLVQIDGQSDAKGRTELVAILHSEISESEY